MIDYPYFTKHKMIVIDADPKAIQEISFTGNLEENSMFFILEDVKESVLNFSQGNVRVLWIYFASI